MSVKYSRSLSGKIIIALLAACGTLLISWAVMNRSFQRIKQPVKRMSEPNPQLRIVNRLLKDVIYLDQLQRLQASSGNIKNYRPFLEQSARIRSSLDSLYILTGANAIRRRRIDTMRSLLTQRDKVFFRYLNLRQGFLENDSLNNKLRLLSEVVSKSALKTDSNIFTSESRISATTIEDSNSHVEEEKKGFWDKLFKRRKNPERREVRHMILEQLKISVDTSLLLHEDSMISQLSQSISAVENERQQSRNTLLRQRVRLDNAGQNLISQLLVMLSEMEHNELRTIEQNNLLATQIIDRGLNRISMILIAFVLLIVILSILIFTDISKSNQYRKELILARDEAEKLGQLRGRFMANMSHELRTPLQAIIGFAEQMKQDADERTRKNSNIIFQSANHLLHVVNEVLDYSRINANKLVIESKIFSVKEVTDSVIETIGIQARQKQLSFSSDTGGVDDTLYYGDPYRLKQILFNLLGNAIKFTERGGISLEVARKVYKRHTAFTFRIADTGIGIPAENHEKIFEHFEQLETDYLQHGTGLGLNIVKNLVAQQNGSISLESTPGQGSVFSVSLAYSPVKPKQDNSRQQVAASFDACVWIIDDDRTILQLCSMILQRYGIRHQCFQAADEVLKAALPEDLEIIFTDIRMPRTDGFELKNLLQQRLETRQRIRFIALTAQSMPEERARIMDSGFDALLVKPFLEKELTDLIYSGNTPVADKGPAGTEDIFRIFVAETTSDLAALRHALQQHDTAAQAAVLHRLAGRLGQLGLKDQSRAARRLEIGLLREEHHTEAVTTFTEDLAAWLATRVQEGKL
ncbi:MAG: response regulator [Chitinophagaceae bacterium]|nr:response regulator [Chitinophagaceae bacterium]